MFSINDAVNYGAVGVCTVVDIQEKRIAGTTVNYYVLRPVFQENSEIFVPTDNQALVSRMTHVLSADEANALVQSIPDIDCSWIDNDRLRNQTFNQILRSGDRQQLIGMIKAIHLQRKRLDALGRHLRSSDSAMVKEAEALLYNELAVSLGISPEQALQLIYDRLKRE